MINPYYFLNIFEIIICVFFKPGACLPQASVLLFFKIDPVQIVGMRVCVCVRVSVPEAIFN